MTTTRAFEYGTPEVCVYGSSPAGSVERVYFSVRRYNDKRARFTWNFKNGTDWTESPAPAQPIYNVRGLLKNQKLRIGETRGQRDSVPSRVYNSVRICERENRFVLGEKYAPPLALRIHTFVSITRRVRRDPFRRDSWAWRSQQSISYNILRTLFRGKTNKYKRK